jgi:flavin-binding protein dodecin
MSAASPRAACKSAVLVLPTQLQEVPMADSVYRVTEVIGVSSESWEAAARNAVETAAGSVRDLRVAEVLRQDLTIENGGVTSFRVRLGISFKYESGQ